ncbi:outer membrane lipid asymmetry maintenance protein MlaD [Paraburkholderia silviterrae]|uniref:Outer membrane lipid asymmetry maintenance protein MlaD n=1 Tax=Paraburkholderia silviterrae TaxID=2528715 RepID=A0A4V2ZY98_9BURK|nr:outer membrane lipid asymmetry maintenance protein MlaD [Paraburkholderia silviterrae]TDG19517.1 outer membrane lipid asymmetry maintenance protein MlaD [Paraburkholderia silviterrae]
MTMKKTALDFWVGLFVVLGFIALLFLALKAGNMSSLSFQPTYAVKLKFDNIGGLKPRAPVKSAGVTVGRVTSIGFDTNTYQALVTINLDQQYQFPKDTSAKILTSGLLGEQYIGLEPGGDTEMLKAGDTISMTQSAIVLENLIGQFLYSKAADSGAAKSGNSAGNSTGNNTGNTTGSSAGNGASGAANGAAGGESAAPATAPVPAPAGSGAAAQ